MKRRTFLGAFPLGAATLLRRQLHWYRQPVADERIGRTIAAVADVMVPGDQLPSASALGIVGHVLDRVLTKPEIRILIQKGVDFLNAEAARQGARDFAELDDVRRAAAVDAAFASNDHALQQFVLALRFHLGTAYYSQAAIKASFAYTGPPQPDGFPDFQDPPS